MSTHLSIFISISYLHSSLYLYLYLFVSFYNIDVTVIPKFVSVFIKVYNTMNEIPTNSNENISDSKSAFIFSTAKSIILKATL